MIARRPPEIAAVAAALGVDVAGVSDAEPAPRPGARGSLMHAWRVARPGPRRASRVAVLPYEDPAWRATVREWLVAEVACTRAWWAWVRDGLGRDAHGVWLVPPLVEPIEEAVAVVDVGGAPGIVRPYLDWPDVTRAGVADDRVRAMWARARDAFASVGAAAGVGLELPDDPLQREDLRRRLLTDGRHLAPTSFRPFLPAFRALDDRRPRIAGP